MLPFVMSAISNLGGAALNFASQENANMANVNLIRQQNAFNERLQREQWSRDDSQYQRTVADMRAAGLNPLAGVSPQSSPLSMQAQAPQVNPVDFSQTIGQLGQAMIAQKELNNQSKQIALNAIRAGVNPNQLSNFDDNELVNLYRELIRYQRDDWKKNAGASGNKYNSVLGKIFNDASDNPITAPIVEGAKKIQKKAIDNAQNAISDVKKGYGIVKNKVSSLVQKIKNKFSGKK